MRAILGLTWQRVDFERGLIDLSDPSRPVTNKRRSVVPMNAMLRASLMEARPAPDAAERVRNIARRALAAAREAMEHV